MTPSPMPPSSPTQLSSRVRLRWENIMIVLIGVIAATFAVVAILASGANPDAARATKDAAAKPAPAAGTAAVAAGDLTIEDANSLVEEARGLMLEARWEEAADRLDTIPADLQALSDAPSAAAELEENRTQYTALRSELDAALEARQYPEARSLLAQLVTIAKHDSSLIELGVTIDDAEAAGSTTPKAKRASKDAATAAADEQQADAREATTSAAKAASAGAAPVRGGGSATKPAAKPGATRPTATKPATPKPAATGGGAGAAAGTGAATTTAPAPALAQATEAEVAAAASFAGIDLNDLTGALSAQDRATLQAALTELAASGQL